MDTDALVDVALDSLTCRGNQLIEPPEVAAPEVPLPDPSPPVSCRVVVVEVPLPVVEQDTKRANRGQRPIRCIVGTLSHTRPVS